MTRPKEKIVEPGGLNMTFQIPTSLKLEHEELHADLVTATQAGGKVGEAAKEVAKVLHDHFVREEEFALPPIGLLSALARGEVDGNMKSVFGMTDRLKAELPQMLEEHKAVVAALQSLVAAAEAENKPEQARFAEKLMLHAQTEEEVLYPAAILIGEYLKLKLKP
jgi:Hemerythrin HHE cation binding domain